LTVAALIAVTAVDMPYWDEWDWAGLVYKMHLGTLAFADLWAQHNEHRMLFPSLIMLGLARLGGWDPVREQFVSLGLVVLSQIAIVALIRRSAHGTAGVIGAAAASIFLYGLWQNENFGWGFQTAWFLCNACAIGVAVLLARPDPGWAAVVPAALLAAIASYSSAQGLVVWAVGAVALALSFRDRVRTLAVWIPAAIAAYVVYRHGMAPADTGHVDVLAQPLTVVAYGLTYLGAPLARLFGSPSSSVAGALLLLTLAASFVADVRSPDRIRRLVRGAPWYALAAYPLVCAAATAFGRGAFGVDQALTGRYTTIASLAWVAAAGLAAGRLSRRTQPLTRAQVGAAGAGAIVFGYAVVANNLHGWSEWKKSAALLTAARSELLASDSAVPANIYPVPARLVVFIGEMRAVRDGPFAGSR
jgi:hypothetical protein